MYKYEQKTAITGSGKLLSNWNLKLQADACEDWRWLADSTPVASYWLDPAQPLVWFYGLILSFSDKLLMDLSIIKMTSI